MWQIVDSESPRWAASRTVTGGAAAGDDGIAGVRPALDGELSQHELYTCARMVAPGLHPDAVEGSAVMSHEHEATERSRRS